MASLPRIYIINASDANEQLEALEAILQKLKADHRIAEFIFLGNVDQLSSIQDQAKDKDAVITLLTFKLEQLLEIRDILKQLKIRQPGVRLGEIIVDNLPYENKYITFPSDLGPLRGRTDIISVWNGIEKKLENMFPAERVQQPELDWKTILKYAIPAVVIIALALWWIYGDPGEDNGNLPDNGDLIVAFTVNTADCAAPCEVTFTNNSKNASAYKWNFGDGSMSSDTNPSHIFDAAGTYTVKLIASKNGKQGEDTREIKVKGTNTETSLVADFSSNKTQCDAPCTVVFSNTSKNADTYLWDFGNGDSSDKRDPSYTFKSGGTFVVKLTASRNDKKHVASHEIVVGNAPAAPAPIAQFIPSKTDCFVPCRITFRNESKYASSYRWEFGDGTSITEINPSHEYKASGNYQVKLVALNSDGIIHEQLRPVTVRATTMSKATNISTGSANARKIKGDEEIDSDDWTGVELSYSTSIVKNGREIELSLVWYSQELNDDKTAGNSNTRFMSKKTFTLFSVDQCCPGAVIDDISGIVRSANSEKEYPGEVHSYQDYPDTGSLRDIKVRFDGPGGQDKGQQSLTATFPSFTVKLRAAN